MGEATRMFWMDRLPPCQSVPYLLLKMAALASRGADALCRSNARLPLESQPVQDGDRWPKSGPGVRRFLIRVGSYPRRPGLPVALDRHRWNNVCHPAVCTGLLACLRDTWALGSLLYQVRSDWHTKVAPRSKDWDCRIIGQNGSKLDSFIHSLQTLI